MAFKYIESTQEIDVTLSDVLSSKTEITGTSYYNESSVKQYVYVENAPLTKFLAKTVSHKTVNDSNPYVDLVSIDKNFKINKEEKIDGVLEYVEGGEDVNGNHITTHIECNLNNVTKDTFQHALVAEVNKGDDAGMRFLIAIPSTRDNDKSEWEHKNFTNLFTLSDGATFHPAVNTGDGQSKPNDGNVIITFNDKVKVAIVDVTDENDNIIVNGNTIESDGKCLSVVCTKDLYNEISENGIKSIKLEIVDTRTIEPIEMAPGEGFVGK